MSGIRELARKFKTIPVPLAFIFATFLAQLIQAYMQQMLGGLALAEYVLAGMVLVACSIVVYVSMASRIEMKRFIEGLNQCTFMRDVADRLETMAHHIRGAQQSIMILSELSRYDEAKKDNKKKRLNKAERRMDGLHRTYLRTLEKVAKREKNNKQFEILRIVVPPAKVRADKSSYDTWKDSLVVHPIYGPHFKKVEESKKQSHMVLKFEITPPQGVSILLIDEQFLMIQHEVRSSVVDMIKPLAGGTFISESGKNTIAGFKLGFKEAIQKSDLLFQYEE